MAVAARAMSSAPSVLPQAPPSPSPEFAVHRHTVKIAAISVAWRDSAMRQAGLCVPSVGRYGGNKVRDAGILEDFRRRHDVGASDVGRGGCLLGNDGRVPCPARVPSRESLRLA